MAELSQLPTIEKGDVILNRDGQSIRVLSVYKPDGTIRRVEGVDDIAESPMRIVVFAKDIMRILRKKEKTGVESNVKIPSEQSVKEKVPVPDALKKDIAERESETVASAKNKKANEVSK